MHEHKLPEFNPLDLLATAASLQRPGRETTSDTPSSPPAKPCDSSSAMRRDTGPRRTRSGGSTVVDNAKTKNKKLESDLKIYKVVVKNELSKMLEEHNYGHPKRNFRYILHDEPFSSVEKETDLKLMDSNCNEYRDCAEHSPQGETVDTPEANTNGNRCDNNCNTLPDKESDCNRTLEDKELAISRNTDCVPAELLDQCGADSEDNSVCRDKNVDKSCSSLEILKPPSECSGSLLPLQDGDEDTDGREEILPEVRHVDRIESCDDEQALVDVETLSTDSKLPDQSSEITGDQAEEEQDSANTLDGFIVSDSCHNCESTEMDSNSGQLLDDHRVENKLPEQSELSHGVNVTGSSGSVRELLVGTPAGSGQQSDTNITGNVKKQTIIRSLLTGETIVVVQKAQNGTKDMGKIPLPIDSTSSSNGKTSLHGTVALKEHTDSCSQSENCLSSSTSLAVTQQQGIQPVSNVKIGETELSECESPVSSDNNSEKTDIEIARQQNRINSEKLELSCKGAIKPIQSVGLTLTPDKHLNSSNIQPVSVTTVVPLSASPPSEADRLLALKSPSLHSALISKLSNGISQRKARVAPVIVPSSRLEQFNIGRFGSVSSSKVGLVRVQARPSAPSAALSVASSRTQGKPRNVSQYENAAYQQVIKQYPNLAKGCKDEELLKIAVAPDEVLECLPSSGSRTVIENHVIHDHDYCVKGPPVHSLPSLSQGAVHLLSDIDREPKLGRPPKNGDRRKKPARKAVEGTGSRANSPLSETLQSSVPSPCEPKGNPDVRVEQEIKQQPSKRRSSRQKAGRDSSPGENPDSPDIDGQGDGSKVKITGAFQDDFVYFINKTSRNRRRTTEQPSLPPQPVVQASDIYIPHLSDADIAALKDKSVSSTSASGPTNITDEDSKVINTILSMENSLERVETSADGFGFNSSNGDALHGLDLTPEQMDILFSAIDGARNDPSVQKFSHGKFGLDSMVETPPVSGQTEESGKSEVSTDVEIVANYTDPGTQLLGNVENLHMPSVDFILRDASSMKTNLPTLDASEVQDSISAITSVNSSTSTTLETGLLSMSSTVDSHVSTAQIGQQSTTVSSSDNKTTHMADLALPSFEKSLDFLGVGEIKTDLFQDMSLPQNSVNTETNSPWIVTVSMYWNDLPAVMLGNQPYVRLVDIYKQILPAKDTGILKKRCQLLGIEVKNCSEMQRYFLVKYGRGYNSKSTLVVAKDDAMRLIGFYVEPQSRASKSDGTADKMPGSPIPAPKIRKPSVISETSCDSTNSGFSSPDIKKDEFQSDPTFPTAKKDRPKSSSPKTASRQRAMTLPDGESVSKRLRHKKINFRNMIQGIKRDDEAVEEELPLSTSSLDPVQQSDTLVTFDGHPQPVRCSRSTSNDVVKPVQSSVMNKAEEKSIPRPPGRQRSYNSRTSLKPARPHSYGLLKPRSVRPYNVLGKQLRRAKGNFSSNGTLQNVLKKRQLNGSVHMTTGKSDDVKLTAQSLASLHVKPEAIQQGEEPIARGNTDIDQREGSFRQDFLPTVGTHKVRSSGRKRKLKQLYPIENYSYTKKARKDPAGGVCFHSTPAEPGRPPRARPVIPIRTSPRKKRTDTTSRLETEGHTVSSSQGISEDEENRPKNVITLTNGPEFETFTALAGEF